MKLTELRHYSGEIDGKGSEEDIQLCKAVNTSDLLIFSLSPLSSFSWVALHAYAVATAIVDILVRMRAKVTRQEFPLLNGFYFCVQHQHTPK